MLAPIAAGGMASVWAARLRGAAGFEKIVAVKTMLPELASEPEYRTMFLDEARVASKLRHPNVCETFDLGEQEGALYMAMEWIDGTSLLRVLRGGSKAARPIAPALAARIVAGACAGLHAAHEATDDDGSPLAVVHRDVSPHNILLSAEGHVKVTDFGIAKAVGKHHSTRAGQAKGKLAYMAPEQLRGATVDRRADVFALGCVLYEITTGRKPFDGQTDTHVVQAILDCAPQRPSTIVDDVPIELERILARAMAKDPRDRFASAEGLRIALERWLNATGRSPTERDLAALVHERCGDEIDQRRAQIRARASEGPQAMVSPSVPAAPARFDRGPAFTIALGLSVVAFAFCSLLWKHPAPPAAAAAEAPKAELVAISEPSTAPAPAPADIAAPSVAEGRVTFVVDPPDASLVVDGEPLEPGESTVERPSRAGEMHVVLVRASGRIDRLFVVDSTTPDSVDAHLTLAEPSASAE